VSDAPDVPSFTERRALEANNCKIWTPLDLLRHMVREIEEGRYNPESVCLVFKQTEGQMTRTGLRRSRCGVLEAVGMLEVAKFDLLSDTEPDP